MRNKKLLGFWEIWNMSFGFLGIQFGFALQGGFMTRFAHISDTHIRNVKYQEEYKIVFKEIYESLEREQPDYIIHTGDIAHTKTQLSPEYFALASEFLKNLADIAPTYIILGNHDGNLKNSDREDAVSPIVNALNHPQLHLLKNSGRVSPQDGLSFNVLSIFDRGAWMRPKTGDINIALYHGAIMGSKTGSGWAMEHGDDDISIFKGHDFVMLGDIHKYQVLQEYKTEHRFIPESKLDKYKLDGWDICNE